MSENTNLISDIAGLSKPVNTLIKKVSNATGILYEPHHIKRVAKAKAKADLIATESEIHITDLHRRAAKRWMNEEAQRQANIENIIAKAVSGLEESAQPENVEDDWIVNFFDKSRIVSDVQMQELWSRILAGETNVPGSYSKRTVNLLADIDKSEAQQFTNLCCFVWDLGYLAPLVYDYNADVYKSMIRFYDLNDLDSIGLIKYVSIGLRQTELSETFKVEYYGRKLVLNRGTDTDKILPLGSVLLTAAGMELATICGGRPIDGFWEYVIEKWKDFSPKESV